MPSRWRFNSRRPPQTSTAASSPPSPTAGRSPPAPLSPPSRSALGRHVRPRVPTCRCARRATLSMGSGWHGRRASTRATMARFPRLAICILLQALDPLATERGVRSDGKVSNVHASALSGMPPTLTWRSRVPRGKPASARLGARAGQHPVDGKAEGREATVEVHQQPVLTMPEGSDE